MTRSFVPHPVPTPMSRRAHQTISRASSRAALLLLAASTMASDAAAQRSRPAKPYTSHGVPASDSAGWALTSVVDGRFQMNTDRAVFHGGAASVRVEPQRGNRSGAAFLTQALRAEPYRGKHVRVRRWVRTDDVVRAIASVGVYGEHAGSILILREYSDGPGADLRGTADWTPVEHVVEVPVNAEFITISFSHIATLATVADGAIVPGRPAAGVLWADDVTVEVVGADLPLSRNGVEKPGTRYPDSAEELAAKREWIAKLPGTLVNGGFEVELKAKTK
jgi:hypothetical protein